MANPHNPTQPTDTHQLILTASSDDIKAIFGDNDIVRLEYPADEFPAHQTRIIIIFTERSGKEPQYIELQEWLDLLEEYRKSQQQADMLRKIHDKQPLKHNDIQPLEHGEKLVCMIQRQW